MRVLFISADVFLSEPLGLMQLSAICKKNSHTTCLATLRRHDILRTVKKFNPDIIAYTAMTPDITSFKGIDSNILKYLRKKQKRPLRIMGGPHASYFPEILKEMNLDAICIGEGDYAIVQIINRVRDNGDLSDIPNVLCHSNYEQGLQKKELITDLDLLPFFDRDIIFEAVPYYRLAQIRSFITSRGCPYRCTYCHNSGYNRQFKGCGPIVRRYSIDRILDEIKYVKDKYRPLKLIRFGDDTFVHKVDKWLETFAERYRTEIGIPFYCLMRSNVFTDEIARILKEAGCVSMSMSVEHGDENVRNKILKRGVSDEVAIRSFEFARKYGIKVQANAMLGIPGTHLDHDLKTFRFLRTQKVHLPTLGIFCPFPGTELTEYAVKTGCIDTKIDFSSHFQAKSVLTCYTEKEKTIQVNIMYLGTIFATLPESLEFIFRLLIKLPLSPVYFLMTKTFWMYRFIGIFPKLIPINLWIFFRIFLDSLSYFKIKKKHPEPTMMDNIDK
jgi:radical SAM superfamily enzyme YgiQ (UPF0313 family)